MEIAIPIIATKHYIDLMPNLIKSINDFFIPTHNKNIFLFTDIQSSELFFSNNCHIIYIKHLPWPLNTLLRFHYFSEITNYLKNNDYVYYMDADVLVSNIIDDEILPKDNEIIATQHFHFQDPNSIGPYETKNEKSLAYIKKNDILKGMYCQACFFGAKSKSFIRMMETIKNQIDIDLKNNIIPIWHDESYFNKYILENNCKRLNSGYCHSPKWGKKTIHMI
jgi:hypothetical protein